MGLQRVTITAWPSSPTAPRESELGRHHREKAHFY